ncbi:hypothetical protein CRYUN_Cryun15aG0078800 [Craigia yunnanensis]
MITFAVRANGIKGPVQITAFGNILQLSRTNQEALPSTGINIAHVPNESAPSVLCIAASIMWNWNALLKGENLTGKNYNQPPDGPYGSCYDHYKVPLEDRFLVEQPDYPWTEELSAACSDSKPQPFPKAVTKQIHQILNSYPKGISISGLRSELIKSKVGLDRDLYGTCEGGLSVSSRSSGDDRKALEEVQQPLPVGQNIAEASNDQVTESHQAPMLEQDSASELSFVRKVWQRWLGGSNGNSEVKNHELPEKHGDSEGSSDKITILKKFTGVSSEREGMKEECEEKSSEVAYPVTVSSSSNDLTVDSKASPEAGENHSAKRSGLFNWIANWCKFWRSSQDSEASGDQSCEMHNQINTNSLKLEVFTQGSFWKDMEILMDSRRGSFLVTQSRTRITRAVEKNPVLGHSHAANGLRSIFILTPQDNLQPKQGEKKLQNIPHSGVLSTIINKKSSDCSRCEILADCQKLVKEILKEHPEGYNMGSFRKLFLERYGYPLDNTKAWLHKVGIPSRDNAWD